MVFLIHYSMYLDIPQSLYYITVNGIYRIAVPLFFVINGYFFFGSFTKGNQSIYIKRMTVLYIIWMIIYAPFWINPSNLSLKDLVRNLLFGFHHLWYLPAVIVSTLIFISIHKLSDKFKIIVTALLYLVGTCIGYLSVLEIHPFEFLSGKYYLYRNGIFFSLFFFTIGFLINKHEIHRKIKSLNIIIVAISSVVLLTLESLILKPFGKDVDMLFSLLLCCPAIFIATLAMKSSRKSVNKDVPNAVYFTHPFAKLTYEAGFLSFSNVFLIGIIATIISTGILIKMPKKIRKILI